MNTTEPHDVRHIIAALRRLVPRLGRRDRETVLTGVEAILELSERLHRAEHPEAYKPQRIKVDVLRSQMQTIAPAVIAERQQAADALAAEPDHETARMADEGCPNA